MYSPKIKETLIPMLYHAAKARNIPMTKLVEELITEALAKRPGLTMAAHEAVTDYNPQPKP